MVGKDYEQGGIIKHGALMINAVSNSKVPHLGVIIGGSYGAANYAMSGRGYDPRFMFSLAQRAVVGDGPGAARGRARRSSPARAAEAPRAGARRGAPTRRCARRSRRRSRPSRPRWRTPARGYDDAIIDPRDTRTVLGLALSRRPQRPTSGAPTASASSGCRCSASSSPTAGRSRAASSRTCRRLGHRAPPPSSPTPDADAPFVREADVAVALGGTTRAAYLRRRRGHRRRAARRRRRRPPGLRLPGRERRLRARGARRRADLDRPVAGGDRGDGLEDRGPRRGWRPPASRSCPARTTRGRATRRLPAAGQGQRGRRRQGHAARRARRGPRGRRRGRARARPARAFGDDTVFLERYAAAARATSRSRSSATRTAASSRCHERDCSVQRRHQKVIEEAPSPAVDADAARAHERRRRSPPARRSATSAPAPSSSCSTEDGEFFFLEVNTRLQVEHPVTELVTGLDLVELQLRVAEGEPRPATPPPHRRPRDRGAPVRRGPGQRLPAGDRARSSRFRDPATASASTPASRTAARSSPLLRPDDRQGHRARRARARRPRAASPTRSPAPSCTA